MRLKKLQMKHAHLATSATPILPLELLRIVAVYTLSHPAFMYFVVNHRDMCMNIFAKNSIISFSEWSFSTSHWGYNPLSVFFRYPNMIIQFCHSGSYHIQCGHYRTWYERRRYGTRYERSMSASISTESFLGLEKRVNAPDPEPRPSIPYDQVHTLDGLNMDYKLFSLLPPYVKDGDISVEMKIESNNF